MRRNALLLLTLSLVLAGAWLVGQPFAVADDPKKEERKDDKGPPPPPKTFTAKKEAFSLDLPVKGHLDADVQHELMLKPDSWAQFQVVKAVPHGSKVNKGDQLVWLDLTKIDEAIKDTEAAQMTADVAHRLAVEELRFFEKLVPLDLAAAEQARRAAEEDLKLYVEKEKALALEGVDQNWKSMVHQLEYTQEELKQLEKMYRTKDLTEDTEELILKRQRRAVENMKFYLKTAEVSRDKQLQFDLPRRDRQIHEATERAVIAFEKTNLTLPMQLRQRKLSIEAATRERQKATERLAKLRKDREMMTITAPASGLVYYGKSQKGNWSSGSGFEQMLQPAGNLAPNQIFMTIVDPSKLTVRGTVDEKDRQAVKAGQSGKLTVTAYPDWKFGTKLMSVGDVPNPGGGFDATLNLEQAEGYEQLRPGLAVTAKLNVYKKPDALVVPDSAVFKDEDDEEQRYVFLSVKKDNKYTHEKKTVKVGKKSGSKVEILDGLKEGDQILQTKPE